MPFFVHEQPPAKIDWKNSARATGSPKQVGWVSSAETRSGTHEDLAKAASDAQSRVVADPTKIYHVTDEAGEILESFSHPKVQAEQLRLHFDQERSGDRLYRCVLLLLLCLGHLVYSTLSSGSGWPLWPLVSFVISGGCYFLLTYFGLFNESEGMIITVIVLLLVMMLQSTLSHARHHVPRRSVTTPTTLHT
jgi:hypothetical protein